MTQQFIVDQYIFDPNDQNIKMPQIPDLRIEGVQLITNLTTGDLIYQFNNVALGGTVSGDVLTLTFDTSSMSATDKLQILYNPPRGGFFDRALSLLQMAVEHLRAPSWVIPAPTTREPKVNCLLATDSAINSVATVTTVTGVTTVTTVNAVSNLTNFNNIDAREMVWSLWDTEYNTGIRNKIT